MLLSNNSPTSNTPSSPSAEHPGSPEGQFLGTPPLPVGHGASTLQDFSLDPSEKVSKFDLDKMNQGELLGLLSKIESKIKGLSLIEVNLEREALKQLQQAKLLQQDASDKKGDIPMNQRASVQNSIANIIKDLAKMQETLYSSEYLKRLTAAVVRIVRTLPKETQVKFFESMDMENERIQAEMLAD